MQISVQHPTCRKRYLIHGYLQGFENGLYYRGKARIDDKGECLIILPERNIENVTFKITPIYNGILRELNAISISDCEFRVYGDEGWFHWFAYGTKKAP